MQAQVGVGMGFGVFGDLGEPRARDHDAGGGGSAAIERGEAGLILRMADRQVVGVDDQQFGVRGIAQPLSGVFVLGQGEGRQERQYKKRVPHHAVFR